MLNVPVPVVPTAGWIPQRMTSPLRTLAIALVTVAPPLIECTTVGATPVEALTRQRIDTVLLSRIQSIGSATPFVIVGVAAEMPPQIGLPVEVPLV